MFTRLRLAFRALFGIADPAPVPCARCVELAQERDYWKAREERTADRLLERQGIAPVAQTPAPPPINPMALAMHAMTITEIDSTKTKSPQPGRDAMTRGAAH